MQAPASRQQWVLSVEKDKDESIRMDPTILDTSTSRLSKSSPPPSRLGSRLKRHYEAIRTENTKRAKPDAGHSNNIRGVNSTPQLTSRNSGTSQLTSRMLVSFLSANDEDQHPDGQPDPPFKFQKLSSLTSRRFRQQKHHPHRDELASTVAVEESRSALSSPTLFRHALPSLRISESSEEPQTKSSSSSTVSQHPTQRSDIHLVSEPVREQTHSRPPVKRHSHRNEEIDASSQHQTLKESVSVGRCGSLLEGSNHVASSSSSSSSFPSSSFYTPSHLESFSSLPEGLRGSGAKDSFYGIEGYLSLVFGTWSDKGRRPTMEDSFTECGDLLSTCSSTSSRLQSVSSPIPPLLPAAASIPTSLQQSPSFPTPPSPLGHLAYFGVFDGHRGWKCASHGRSHLHQFILNQMSLANRYSGQQHCADFPSVLSRSFIQLDRDFKERFPKNEAGSTAAVCLVETSSTGLLRRRRSKSDPPLLVSDPPKDPEHRNGQQQQKKSSEHFSRLHLAHVGDTRAVLCHYPRALRNVAVLNTADLPEEEWDDSFRGRGRRKETNDDIVQTEVKPDDDKTPRDTAGVDSQPHVPLLSPTAVSQPPRSHSQEDSSFSNLNQIPSDLFSDQVGSTLSNSVLPSGIAPISPTSMDFAFSSPFSHYTPSLSQPTLPLSQYAPFSQYSSLSQYPSWYGSISSASPRHTQFQYWTPSQQYQQYYYQLYNGSPTAASTTLGPASILNPWHRLESQQERARPRQQQLNFQQLLSGGETPPGPREEQMLVESSSRLGPSPDLLEGSQRETATTYGSKDTHYGEGVSGHGEGLSDYKEGVSGDCLSPNDDMEGAEEESSSSDVAMGMRHEEDAREICASPSDRLMALQTGKELETTNSKTTDVGQETHEIHGVHESERTRPRSQGTSAHEDPEPHQFFRPGQSPFQTLCTTEEAAAEKLGHEFCHLYLPPLNLPLLESEQLTFDHKPIRWDERKRIEEGGGSVVYQGCWRIYVPSSPYMLAVSRALGNWSMKLAQEGVLIADPELTSVDLDPSTDLFLIIATDGIWDVCSNQEAVRIVGEALNKEERMCVERHSRGGGACASEETPTGLRMEDAGDCGREGSHCANPTTTSSSALGSSSVSSPESPSPPPVHRDGAPHLKGRYAFLRTYTSSGAVRLAAKALVDHCLRLKTEDNLTCTVIRFCWHPNSITKRHMFCPLSSP